MSNLRSETGSRSALFLLLAALSLPLAACLSLPHGLESMLTAEGAHATNTLPLGPVVVVSTASLIPGSQPAPAPRSHLAGCQATSRSRVAIWINGWEDSMPDGQACETLLAAVGWVLGSADLDRDVDYELTFVPPDHRRLEKRTRIHSARRLTLAYTFAWNPSSPDHGLADAADTLGHETTHVIRALQRVRGELRTEEDVAYKLGRCAQFVAVGWLRLDDMQTDVVAAEGAYRNAGTSMAAGYASAREFAKYFDDSRMVRRGSPAGDALQADCVQSLERAVHPRPRARSLQRQLAPAFPGAPR